MAARRVAASCCAPVAAAARRVGGMVARRPGRLGGAAACGAREGDWDLGEGNSKEDKATVTMLGGLGWNEIYIWAGLFLGCSGSSGTVA